MKVICFLVAGVFTGNSIIAQKKVNVSINAGLALPVGQLATTNLMGGAFGVVVAKPVSRHVSVLADAGVVNMIGKDKNGFKYDSRHLLGFTAGARYAISRLTAKAIWYSQLKGGIHSDKGYAGPAVEGGLGCLLYPATNRLDLSVRYQENFQEHQAYHTRFYSLRVGYVLQFKPKTKKKN